MNTDHIASKLFGVLLYINFYCIILYHIRVTFINQWIKSASIKLLKAQRNNEEGTLIIPRKAALQFTIHYQIVIGLSVTTLVTFHLHNPDPSLIKIASGARPKVTNKTNFQSKQTATPGVTELP